MPFKEDRRSQWLAQGIATLICGVAVGLFLYLAYQPRPHAELPPELRIPPHRPSIAPAIPRESPQRPEPEIRVNVTATPLKELRVSVRGPYQIAPVGSSKELLQGESLSETTLSSADQTLNLGRKSWTLPALEIRPLKSDLVWINDHAYHGVIKVYRQKSGKLTAVNALPLEQYIACVIDSEMPAKFPVAARRAQAIVARTYALWQKKQADPAANYDVFATVRSQKYLGAEYLDGNGRRLAGESPSSRDAVAATRGQVCRIQGRLFCTYYSAVCGGATTPGKELFSDADEALRSVRCEWCQDSDKYRWSVLLTNEEVLQAVRKQPNAKHLTGIKSIQPAAGSTIGSISEFEISDGRHTVTLSGVTLRQNIPGGKLLSPHFALRLVSGKVHVDGRGHGHGAGFCQWGARGLANAGKSATEIVEYYFPGAQVTAGGY